MNKTTYLIVVEGDVSPELHLCKDEEDRLQMAKNHRHSDPDLKDGLYKLDINWTTGKVWTGTFKGIELEDKE